MGNRTKELLQHVDIKVTNEMNQRLIEDFSEEEIEAALDSIGGLKAPGEDGMPTLFYKKYWQTMHVDVVREINNSCREATCHRGGTTLW